MLEAYFVQIRHKQFLAEAESNRLLELAEKKNATSISTAGRLLVYIGGLIRRWGSWLEDRYTIDSKPHHNQPVDRRMEL